MKFINYILLVIFCLITIVSCNLPHAVTVTTNNVATINGKVVAQGEFIYQSEDGASNHGFCWDTIAEPSISNTRTNRGKKAEICTFTDTIKKLRAATYFMRAYAVDGQNPRYGQVKEVRVFPFLFINETSKQVSADAGKLSIQLTANVNWWITSGKDWLSISPNSGAGDTTISLEWSKNESDYARSGDIRFYYSNSVSPTVFSLSQQAAGSTVTTEAVNAITQTTANCGGQFYGVSLYTIYSAGVCWSTSHNPTFSDNRTDDLNNTKSFASKLTGLRSGTVYYVRAYVKTNIKTIYGNELSFTTLSDNIPTLSTAAPTLVTSSTASSGGIISSDGGATITARGVCWSTSSNPTIANNKTNDGTGTGSFTSNITGLSEGTTYYVRAYATNSKGTTYGTQQYFTTIAFQLPTLTTSIANAITYTTASSGGTISSDGGATITSRGVCWSTSSNPTIANNKTNDGTGTGSFTSNITGLSEGTTYYVRAYATDSKGTTYGDEIIFTTRINSTITDVDGNTYKTIIIGTQTWMAANLKTTKYTDGSMIPNVTNASTWAALTTGAQCDYNNTTSNTITYGKLYNWYAVNTAKLCPTGWHVPSNKEWTVLTSYLGSVLDDTGKLREIGNTHWLNPATNATNETGFTALPAGYRNTYSSFFGIGISAYWWSSTEISSTLDAWYRDLSVSYGYDFVNEDFIIKTSGMAVRCLKD